MGRVYELEDYNGNTVCGFRIDDNGNIVEITDNLEHHDNDEDYLFKSEEQLERIQMVGY